MNTQQVQKITIKEPPRELVCHDCNRKTTHYYLRPGVFGKVYVCQLCGKERTA